MKRQGAGVLLVAAAMAVAVAVLVAAGGCGRTPEAPPGNPPTVAPEADVDLDTVHTYQPATVRLAVPQPATVELPDTRDLLQRLAADAGTEAVVTLEFAEPAAPADFSLVVFVNTPGAGADTPVTAPGFVGTVGFPHPGSEDPVRAVLPATDAIRGAAATGPVTFTIVPVGYPDRPVMSQVIEVTVSVAVVRSFPR
jgi:hypothetical protein